MAPEEARDFLKYILEKSRDMDLAIQETASRLHTTKLELESLQESFKEFACKRSLYNLGSHVDRVMGPAASVVRIFHVIQELQTSLLPPHGPSSDLRAYLSTVQQIEDAVVLLRDSSRLVILWLQDAMQFLNASADDDHWYISNLKKALKILGELEEIGQSFSVGGGGGVLTAAFNQLENEFRRLLADNSFPCSFSSPDNDDRGMALIPSPSFPPSDIQKMHTIMEKFAANNRPHRCASIYVEVRTSNVRAALQGLDLGYLQLSLSGFHSVQNFECYIDQWSMHLQFVVKYVLEAEYRLCHEVFQNAGFDEGLECFANIVIQSGFHDFIKFGNTITRGKKEAIKLLKLLDIFATLNNLRLDFNRLFSGKSCLEIRNQTRDLVTRVINGACEIFWDLSVQVESQRLSVPPIDGSVPMLVAFVTDFCNLLLENEYRHRILDVLEIKCCWSNLEFEEGLLTGEIQSIMKALELNFQTWGGAYENAMLTYFFTMNNYWYLCENIKGTKLGDLMGHTWLMSYEETMEQYLAIYLRESWEKLPTFLSEDGLILFPGGRAIDHDLAQNRLNEFNKAFEDMYAKQIYWVLSDKRLRQRTRHLIVQAIIPCYKNYVQKYMNVSEGEEEDARKRVKYSLASLQDMINFLFQPKLGKSARTKDTNAVSKIKDVVTNSFPSTPAAA